MRVVKNGDGSEAMLTAFQTPEMTDEGYAEDLKKVEKDLKSVRHVRSEKADRYAKSHVTLPL